MSFAMHRHSAQVDGPMKITRAVNVYKGELAERTTIKRHRGRTGQTIPNGLTELEIVDAFKRDLFDPATDKTCFDDQKPRRDSNLRRGASNKADNCQKTACPTEADGKTPQYRRIMDMGSTNQ